MWRALRAFCEKHDVRGPEGVSETTMCAFVTHLHLRGVKAVTAKSYVAAIGTMSEIEGSENAVSKMKKLHRLIEGMRREGAGRERKERLPITVEVLEMMEEDKTNVDLRESSLKALSWTATCGLFRLGELTGEKAARLAHTTLWRGEKAVTADQASNEQISTFTHFSIKLTQSKTDVEGNGQVVWIAQPTAVNKMKEWLRRRKEGMQMNSNSPLLMTELGRAWKTDQVVAEVRKRLARAGLRADFYSGHSFRIGGATTLALRGTPTYLIKKMGRWTSDCFLKYIHDPVPAILRESGAM